MAWSAGQQCALLPPLPSCLTTPCSAAGLRAPLSLGTGREHRAVPGQGAQRDGTYSNSLSRIVKANNVPNKHIVFFMYSVVFVNLKCIYGFVRQTSTHFFIH